MQLIAKHQQGRRYRGAFLTRPHQYGSDEIRYFALGVAFVQAADQTSVDQLPQQLVPHTIHHVHGRRAQEVVSAVPTVGIPLH